MGGGEPEVPKVDAMPNWLQQEEDQAATYGTQQNMITAQSDTANFMARYGTRRNVAAGTVTSETSQLYSTVGSMPFAGLGDPTLGTPSPNPLLQVVAGAPGSVGVTGRGGATSGK